ncbi:hypothetical protein HPB52_001098 [Rhipicephalus sanguineus]|uniref:Uncharacterized protein n=1 Tax=Rhipicephalus sanguineus TaxID=34632 RepID=A0A9D4QFC6_RHISA|nr:hypothetical protein HPB52_001098 [Rhipicephalus sanguineus]
MRASGQAPATISKRIKVLSTRLATLLPREALAADGVPHLLRIAAVPMAADENAELLTDEVEAEEASAGSVKEVKVAATKSPKLQGQTTAGAAGVTGTPARPLCKDSAADVRKTLRPKKKRLRSRLKNQLTEKLWTYAHTGGVVRVVNRRHENRRNERQGTIAKVCGNAPVVSTANSHYPAAQETGVNGT